MEAEMEGFDPEYEEIALRGSLPVTALALAGDACIVYARLNDLKLFRALCRRHGAPRAPRASAAAARRITTAKGRATPKASTKARWDALAPGPSVDRRSGYTETVLLWALPSHVGSPFTAMPTARRRWWRRWWGRADGDARDSGRPLGPVLVGQIGANRPYAALVEPSSIVHVEPLDPLRDGSGASSRREASPLPSPSPSPPPSPRPSPRPHPHPHPRPRPRPRPHPGASSRREAGLSLRLLFPPPLPALLSCHPSHPQHREHQRDHDAV